MVGRVEEYLLNRIVRDGAIHVTLIDPEKVNPKSVSTFSKDVQDCQTTAVMVGGTTLVSSVHLDDVVKAIKKAVDIPVILFPNNVTGISKHADAIWFMSLLNSTDPYFIAGAQVLGAPLIKMYGLEPIPLGYIIAGEGGAVSVVGRALPIPYNKPELACAHALAAQFFGMRFVYLEGGSGVRRPVPAEMIRAVKRVIDIPLIVGGGVRTAEQAVEVASAGADAVVTSTVLEESEREDARGRLVEIVQSVREGAMRRRQAKGTITSGKT